MELTEIYPFNLIKNILDSTEKARKIYLPGVSTALATLTEREQDILRRRFMDKLTLEKCGNIHGITRERVRQIEAKAMRKLRHPSRQKLFMAMPVSAVDELHVKYNKLSREYELLQKAFELCVEKPADQEVIVPMAELAVIMQTPINELDFSVRTYNCLARAGKKTIRDIAEMTEEELMHIRNLGKKSALEVIEKLSKYGLELKGVSNGTFYNNAFKPYKGEANE